MFNLRWSRHRARRVVRRCSACPSMRIVSRGRGKLRSDNPDETAPANRPCARRSRNVRTAVLPRYARMRRSRRQALVQRILDDTAKEFRVICPTCKSEGKKSYVTPGGRMTTDMFYPPYYDEDGVYHHHDRNTVTADYSCSRGHQWTENQRNQCPSCSWPDEGARVPIHEMKR